MAFSLTAWLFSKSFSIAESKLNSFFNSKDLQSKLQVEIDAWSQSLPENCRLVSVAMYLDFNDNNSNSAVRTIGQMLDQGLLPPEDLLFEALYNKWEGISQEKNKQDFFTVSKGDAKDHLSVLARRLHGILLQEEKIFKRYLQQNMLALNANDEEVLKRLEKLEAMLRNSSQGQDSTKKVYRSIPDCHLYLPPDIETRKALTLTVFKIALFQSFQSFKYKKFTCLLHYSANLYTSESGTELPGISIFSGEVVFQRNLARLANRYISDEKEFIEFADNYFNNEVYQGIVMRIGIPQNPGFYPFEIEMDGQNREYNIRPVKSKNVRPADLSSLNTALVCIAKLVTSDVVLVDYDEIQESASMLKFLHDLMKNRSFSFSKFVVNTEDFDDWDYEYALK